MFVFSERCGFLLNICVVLLEVFLGCICGALAIYWGSCVVVELFLESLDAAWAIWDTLVWFLVIYVVFYGIYLVADFYS